MDLNKLVKAHRFLYYVLGTPIIGDHAYDELEREAPQTDLGSSNADDYTESEMRLAYELLEAAEN